MFIMTKTRKHKFKDIISDKKHLINLQVVKVIAFKMFIKNYKITFSSAFNINKNIFMIY